MSERSIHGVADRRTLLTCGAMAGAVTITGGGLLTAHAAGSAKKAIVVPPAEGKKLNILGHSATVKLAEPEAGGDYYVFDVVSPPGAGIPPHVHRNEDEIIHIAEGDYEIFLGGRKYRASAGTTIHFPRAIPHGFRNVGGGPGKTLWTVVPGKKFELFFEELAALPPGRPPDMAKVAAIFKAYDIALLPPN